MLLVFLLVALHPSLITKAAESENVWNSWDSNTSTSITYHNSNNHEAIQDGDYLYFSTSGKNTSYGAQYETIGAKLSYQTSGDYVYLGGKGVSESRKTFTSGGVDYVMHRVLISSISDNMADVKSAFDKGSRITLIFDPVYAPLIEGVVQGSVDGVRTKSYRACTDYANTVNIPKEWGYPEWSAYAKKVLKDSFLHRVTLRTPPSIVRDTTPINRGLTFVSGSLKKDLKAGESLTGTSYSNLYYSGNYGTSWVKSNTPILMNWTGYQEYPYNNDGSLKGGLDANDTIKNIGLFIANRSIGVGLFENKSTFMTFKDPSINSKPTSLVTSSTDYSSVDKDYNGISLVGSTTLESINTTWYSRGNRMDHAFDAIPTLSFSKTDKKYHFFMRTMSNSGACDQYGYSNPDAIIYVDDYGPTWTDPTINAEGYKGSNLIELKDLVDYTGPSKMAGSGINRIGYKVYGSEQSEPTEETLSVTTSTDPKVLPTPLSSLTVNVDDSSLGNSNSIIVKVTVYDNLENSTTKTYSLKRAEPIPTTTVDLVDWKYSEPQSLNRWVPNATNAKVVINSATPSWCKYYPDTNNLVLKEKTSGELLTDYSFKTSGKIYNKGVKGIIPSSSSTNALINGSNSLVSTVTTIGNETLNNKKFELSGAGSINYETKIFSSKQVTEKDGELLCFDTVSPQATLDVMGRSNVTPTLSDAESGLAKVEFWDDDRDTLLFSRTISTPSNCIRMAPRGMIVVDLKGYAGSGFMIVTDNVGNVTTVPFDPIQYSEISGSITHSEIVREDKKTWLQVNVVGVGTNAPFSDPNNFVFRFTGNGYKVNLDGSDVFAISKKKAMKEELLIPDDVNTTSSPVISYSSEEAKATISWTELQDVTKFYAFNLYGDILPLPEDRNLLLESDTNNRNVLFSTGRHHYNFKLWPVSSIGEKPAVGAVVGLESNPTTPKIDVSTVSTGIYYVQVVMLDGNGNPSGIGEQWISHVQPTLTLPLALSVTAVKDVKWEKEKYPFVYSDLGGSGGIENTFYSGKDFSKFSLGKDYKPVGITEPIYNGYVINYRLKRTMTDISKVTVNYKFKASDGTPVDLKFNGKDLATLDISDHTNYTSQVISSVEDLAKFNTADGFLVKHLVPATSVASYQGTATDYTGEVDVIASFTFTTTSGLVSDPQDVPLYTMSMSKSAYDDIGVDKQR